MALGMRLTPSLRLTMTCRVCGQTIDEENVNATRIHVALFGAEPLAACPSCEQEVAERTPEYELRARRFLAAAARLVSP